MNYMESERKKTWFSHWRNGRMDGRTDKPSFRDEFLMDAFKKDPSNQRKKKREKKKKRKKERKKQRKKERKRERDICILHYAG